MSTTTSLALRRPRGPIIGWLAAIGCLVTGVVLLAANGALVSSHATQMVLGVSASSVGALILLKRRGHGVGLICLAAGILAGLGVLGPGIAHLVARKLPDQQLVPGVGLLAGLYAPLLAYLLIGPVLLGAFPSGRFGRVGRWVAALAVVMLIPMLVFSIVQPATVESHGMVFHNPLWINGLPGDVMTTWGVVAPLVIVAGLVFLGGYVLASISLAMRYRTSNVHERLQIRWVAVNEIAIVAAPILVAVLIQVLSIGRPEGVYDPNWRFVDNAVETLLLLVPALVPVSVGVAILRYRLYDIDRIVSNAIGYGIVTVVLFGVFAAVNLALVSQVSPLVNNEGVAVAAATLLVAALFNPVRVRVQRGIDRRFHRAHYDAERMVADFAARLRDELDLPTLSAELAITTARAVEPTTASLWLRRRGA